MYFNLVLNTVKFKTCEPFGINFVWFSLKKQWLLIKNLMWIQATIFVRFIFYRCVVMKTAQFINFPKFQVNFTSNFNIPNRVLLKQFVRSMPKRSVGTSGVIRPHRIWRRRRRRARCGEADGAVVAGAAAAGAKLRSIWLWTCHQWTNRTTRTTTQNPNTGQDTGIPMQVSPEWCRAGIAKQNNNYLQAKHFYSDSISR